MERALAFVARRQGRTTMPAVTWSQTIAFDLRWMGPAEATAYVARALEAGLFIEEAGQLRLSFDPSNVQVPRGYKPEPDDVARAHDPFLDWLEKLRAAGVEDPMEAITATQERHGGLLTAEAAALVVAAGAGLDVRGAAREALERMAPEATSDA